MIEGALSGALGMWILSLFGVDMMILEFISKFTEVALTTNDLYVIAIVVGIVGGALRG